MLFFFVLLLRLAWMSQPFCLLLLNCCVLHFCFDPAQLPYSTQLHVFLFFAATRRLLLHSFGMYLCLSLGFESLDGALFAGDITFTMHDSETHALEQDGIELTAGGNGSGPKRDSAYTLTGASYANDGESESDSWQDVDLASTDSRVSILQPNHTYLGDRADSPVLPPAPPAKH